MWEPGGLRDDADERKAHPPLIVGEFMTVFFKLCLLDEGFIPRVTDEERVEEIHWLVV